MILSSFCCALFIDREPLPYIMNHLVVQLKQCDWLILILLLSSSSVQNHPSKTIDIFLYLGNGALVLYCSTFLFRGF